MKKQLSQAVALFESFREKRPRKLATLKVSIPNVVACMGYLQGIDYQTTHKGKVTLYHHDFSDGSRPLLCVSGDGRQLMLLGGHYKWDERGVVDRDARGKDIINPKHARKARRKANPAQPQSKVAHQEELTFILDVLKDFPKYSGSFNDDWQTFARYADMQSNAAARDGYGDIADVMKAAANRARRKRKANPLHAEYLKPREQRAADPYLAGARDAREGLGFRPRDHWDKSRQAEYRLGYESGAKSRTA